MSANFSNGKTMPSEIRNGDMSPIYRIRCDKIIPNSNIEIIAQIVSTNPTVNGQFPQTLLAPRRRPSWLGIEGSHTARYRKHHLFKTICLVEKCDIPPMAWFPNS